MSRPFLALGAMTVVFSSAAFAQHGPAVAPAWGYWDTFQVNNLTNLQIADGVVNLTQAGFHLQPGQLGINQQYLCANIYVFGGIGPIDPSGEQLQACCSCPITRNGTRSVRARQLVSNLLTPIGTQMTSANIKIVWTTPPGGPNAPASCNPAGLPATNLLAAAPATGATAGGFASGGRAWATRWHQPLTVPGSPATPGFSSETAFEKVPLSAAETNLLNQFCGFIQLNGSGFGICPGCPTGGAQGADRM